MVLLSNGYSGGVSILLLLLNKVLFLHHDIDSPIVYPSTQLCMSFSPSCRSLKVLRESKLFS